MSESYIGKMIAVENKAIITEIVETEFGEARSVLEIEQWGGGAHNTCFRVTVSNPMQTLFLKIEKEDIFPRTRRCQIEREVSGSKLVARSGVPCPAVLGFSFVKKPVRYLLQEFIDAKLIGELLEEYSEEERQQVSQNIRGIAEKIEAIHSDTFGEVFEGGEIGRHHTWKGMMAHLSGIMLEDMRISDVFTADEINIITTAHARALQSIRYAGRPSLVHLDLHEFNLFSGGTAKTDILKVFDFGFVLFMAPYASHYGPQAFAGNETGICGRYSVTPEELTAFDIIFSLELVNFIAGIRFAPEEPYGYIARKNEYINKCKIYPGTKTRG